MKVRVDRIVQVSPRVPVVAGGVYTQNGSTMILLNFDDGFGSDVTWIFVSAAQGTPLTDFKRRQDIDDMINDRKLGIVYRPDAELVIKTPDTI